MINFVMPYTFYLSRPNSSTFTSGLDYDLPMLFCKMSSRTQTSYYSLLLHQFAATQRNPFCFDLSSSLLVPLWITIAAALVCVCKKVYPTIAVLPILTWLYLIPSWMQPTLKHSMHKLAYIASLTVLVLKVETISYLFQYLLSYPASLVTLLKLLRRDW